MAHLDTVEEDPVLRVGVVLDAIVGLQQVVLGELQAVAQVILGRAGWRREAGSRPPSGSLGRR
jgi:hypothetical protein